MMPPHLQHEGDAFDRRLTTAFRTGLDLPPDTDVPGLRFGEHRNWDSLGHMSLIVALEEEFGVELVDDGALDIDSYAAAATVVRSQLRCGE